MTAQFLKRLALVLALAMTMGLFATQASRAEQTPEAAPVDMGSKTSTMQMSDLEHKNIQGAFDEKHEKYVYLSSIGKTIDAAREHKDAESLAMAALLLFQAEKQSGKKSADVTAQSLLDEATKLAELQKSPTALKVVAQVWGDTNFGPADAAKAKSLNDKAQVYAAEKQSAKRGSCRLVLRNRTDHTVDVYADNQYLGTIDPWDTRYVYVENGYTELFGHARCHNIDWGPSNYRLGSEFTWRLTP